MSTSHLVFRILFFAALFVGPPFVRSIAKPEEPRIIRVGVPAYFPPHYLIDAHQKPFGFAIEVFDEIAKKAGVQPKYVVFDNWQDVHSAILEQRVDVVPNMGITKERIHYALFTTPLETNTLSIFKRRTDDHIRIRADLKDKVVLVIEGNTLANKPHEEFKESSVRIARGIEEAIFQLLAGQADALTYPKTVVDYHARQAGIEHRLEEILPPIREIKRAIAVRRGDPDLAARLNQEALEFTSTPQYRSLYSKWFGTKPPFWANPLFLWMTGGFFLILLASLVTWRFLSVMKLNRRLVAEVNQRERPDAERKQLEIRLRQSEKMQAIGTLAGGIAHDFNNILQGLVLVLTKLDRSLDAHHPFHTTIERGKHYCSRGRDLVRQIQTYTRHELDEPSMVNLPQLAQDAIALIQPQAPPAVKIEFLNSASSPWILGNSTKIHQMLCNLLTNAGFAMRHQGGTLSVRLSESQMTDPQALKVGLKPGNYLTLEVQDTGEGIPDSGKFQDSCRVGVS